MKAALTNHALRRVKQRSLRRASVARGLSGAKATYLGFGKYRSEKGEGKSKVTVIYKKSSGKRVAITAWKG